MMRVPGPAPVRAQNVSEPRVSHDPTISQDAADIQRARQRSSQKLRPPVEVAGYEFERFLGSGAFGEVWVAVDRNTGRRTAVKFYTHRGGVDWSQLSREVEKLAFLFNDRYVVQLVDVGWSSDPPYYVMEYLERGSLSDRLQGGPMSVGEAVGMFREIAVGLVHAHDKGVLHCDLKPANVL
jgi:serine/threonine protein kinase